MISALVSRATFNRPASVHVVTTTLNRITSFHPGRVNWPFCKLQYESRKTSGTSAIVLVGFWSRSISVPSRNLANRRAIVSAAEFDGAHTRSEAFACVLTTCKTLSTQVFVFP